MAARTKHLEAALGGRRPGAGSREPGFPRSRVPAEQNPHAYTQAGPSKRTTPEAVVLLLAAESSKNNLYSGEPEKNLFFSSLIPKLYSGIIACVRATPTQFVKGPTRHRLILLNGRLVIVVG